MLYSCRHAHEFAVTASCVNQWFFAFLAATDAVRRSSRQLVEPQPQHLAFDRRSTAFRRSSPFSALSTSRRLVDLALFTSPAASLLVVTSRSSCRSGCRSRRTGCSRARFSARCSPATLSHSLALRQFQAGLAAVRLTLCHPTLYVHYFFATALVSDIESRSFWPMQSVRSLPFRALPASRIRFPLRFRRVPR